VIVTKFGGTSVADAAAIARLAAIVRARSVDKPVVVVSALAGVSDQLAATCKPDGRRDEPRLAPAIAALEARHRELISSVAGAGAVSVLDPWLQALRAGPRDDGPQAHAEWMALGELLSSNLVSAALRHAGVPARCFDVRDVLRTRGENVVRDRVDERTTRRLVEQNLKVVCTAGTEVVVTQGFIARDAAGRTTLLGRGGSDLSASLLGTALAAELVEIWTDVDGVLTGPPHIVPGARRLKILSFEEAAELAYFGAKVLHPASIRPAKEAGIPVLVANSHRVDPQRFPADELPGTLILEDIAQFRDERCVVRSVAVKDGITVVTIHSSRMLMAHGFLERIFAVFSKHATAVDLVSTSEVSVSLTVDDTHALRDICSQLRRFARVEVTSDMAIVCVVGEGMPRARGIVGRVFRAVGNAEVRMISQGASEINVSLVVAAAEADVVVRRLHDEFFQANLPSTIFGESPRDLERARTAGTHTRSIVGSPLVQQAHALADAHGTPFFVYDLDRVVAQIDKLRSALRHPRAHLAYACKANFHPAIFRLASELHVGIDAVSPMEVERALACGIPASEILFTANNVSPDTLCAVNDSGVRVNLGSVSDARRFAALRPNSDVFLRINPGLGAGHHVHVVTGGVDTKFGLNEDELPAAREALAAHGARVVGLHAHIGSGILDPAPLLDGARRLARSACLFPDVRWLNVGGGLGVPSRPSESEFDVARFGTGLIDILREAEAELSRELELWVEPGRYLVAQCGVLVATVTCRKQSAGHVYIGLDTGMNHLVRPALYGSYHAIRNWSAPDAPLEFVDVVGNVCESADVFAFNRPVPSPQEGHRLAIEDAGAYGFAMASHYNLWPLPREFVLREGRIVAGLEAHAS
jgi:diaminopimelate decarboxylase/aspartate kinase